MRTVRMLDPDAPGRIVAQAREVLAQVGVEVRSREALALLGDWGARIDSSGRRAYLPDALVDRALATVPAGVKLFDAHGRATHDIGGDRVYFAPGSSALRLIDGNGDTHHFPGQRTENGECPHFRAPLTADYVRYAKVVSGLSRFPAQSTAFVPADVHPRISDSYRLFLSLLLCEKPVITGTFSPAGLGVMFDLLTTVRGTAAALREKPLAIFTCCPTSPLKWSAEATEVLLACGRAGVPVEIVPMPLAGFTAPATLATTVVQHAAEALSGIVLHQLAAPGAPLLYGGSTAIFDVRHETTPMGAVETMMLACACAQVGTSLGLPTQAYIALSDAKELDAQGGAETGIGAVLAALSGINSISGPGMLEFENAFSIEKLVLDDEICGIAQRLRHGVSETDAADAIVPLMRELVAEGHLLIADHTRLHAARQISRPSDVIDRATHARWVEGGGRTLRERAAARATEIERRHEPVVHAAGVERALAERMQAAARAAGMDRLPDRSCAGECSWT